MSGVVLHTLPARHSPRRERFATWSAAIVAGACVAWLSGCAPQPATRAAIDEGQREARYRRALASRLERAQGVEAATSVWVKPTDADALPGMTGRLLLGQPNAFRVRIESLFGTALDLAARGDSLDAYVPPRRVGFTVDSAGDSLGVRDPGRLVWRAGSAAWDAPRDAWQEGELRDSVRVVRWSESKDQIELEVGGSGLPVAVRVRRGANEVWLRYARWSQVQGVAWPVRVVAQDGRQRVEVTCALEHVKFRSRPATEQLTVQIPEGAERMTGRELRKVWELLAP